MHPLESTSPLAASSPCNEGDPWVVADAAHPDPAGGDPLARLIGESHAAALLRQRVVRAAGTRANVLIQGESGTGKELVARAIHALSDRAGRPLVVIQCGTIPDAIAASELFGHERGAFTDARAPRRGRFEAAHKGTLFLDEVGDLSPHVQVHILRTIQFGEISRVGSDLTSHVDVRIIAATHRPLEAMAADGRFRHDLYWRLNELPIRVPPLRDRPEDVPGLALRFLERANASERRAVAGFSDRAMAALVEHPWPGNVRELEHRVRRAVIEAANDELLEPPAFDLGPPEPASGAPRLGALLDETEAGLVTRALELCAGNRTRAAQILGVSRRTLQKKVARYRLK